MRVRVLAIGMALPAYSIRSSIIFYIIRPTESQKRLFYQLHTHIPDWNHGSEDQQRNRKSDVKIGNVKNVGMDPICSMEDNENMQQIY